MIFLRICRLKKVFLKNPKKAQFQKDVYMNNSRIQE